LNVLGSILGQLCLQTPDAIELVRDLFDSSLAPSGIRRRPDHISLQTIIYSLLEKHRASVLIDAIDECKDREILLSFLSDLVAGPLHVNVIVTGRDETDIRKGLVLYRRVTLESRSRELAKDISLYVRSRIQDEPGFSWLSDVIKTEIEERLTKTEDDPHM